MGLETVRCNQDCPPAPSYVGQILFSCVSSAFLVLLLVSVSHVNSHIVESHKEVHPEERIRKHPARTHIVACFRACVFQRRRGADSFGTSCSPSLYSVLTPPWSVLTQSWYFGSPIVLTLLRTLAHHLLTLYLPRSPIFLLCTYPILGTPFTLFLSRSHSLSHSLSHTHTHTHKHTHTHTVTDRHLS